MDLAFGAAPHGVPKDKMIFDPLRGGWVREDDKYGRPAVPNKAALSPPKWMEADPFAPKIKNSTKLPRARDKLVDSKHFENAHYGDHRLDMLTEVDLGLAPPDWSVSSKVSPQCWTLTPHPSLLAPHSSSLIRHPSPLI